MDEQRQEQLILEAWRVLGDLIDMGEATLKGGKALKPATGDLIKTLQWAAGQRKPRKSTVKLSEDFHIKETQ